MLLAEFGDVASSGLFMSGITQWKAQMIARDLYATKCFMMATVVVLVWEHLLTLPQEVERIWKQPRCLASMLFCLNRYMTLFQFTLTLFAYHQAWSHAVCAAWYRFCPGLCVVSVTIAESVLVLRTYALYNRSKYVLVGLLLLLAGQAATMGYCVAISTYMRLRPPLKGCIPVGRFGVGVLFYIAPLVTDTVIFTLTVVKTSRYLRHNVRTSLPRMVLRDGIIYFVLIVLVNMMNVVIYALSPTSLKALGSNFSQVLTTVLISRLQLNLLGRSVPSSLQHGSTSPHCLRTLPPSISVPYHFDSPPPIRPRSAGFAAMFNAPISSVMTGSAMSTLPTAVMYPQPSSSRNPEIGEPLRVRGVAAVTVKGTYRTGSNSRDAASNDPVIAAALSTRAPVLIAKGRE